MDTAKARAEQFKVLVANEGWDEALDTFNRLYGQAEPNQVETNEADSNQAEPNATTEDLPTGAQRTFRLQQLTRLSRIPELGLVTFAALQAGSPDANVAVNSVEKEAMLRDTLYSLVPPDSNSLDAVPYILEFKPELSYYCIKSLLVRRISRDQYEIAKVRQSYRTDFVESQSLAPVHFNPENIAKRMKFKLVTRDREPADANLPAETGGTS